MKDFKITPVATIFIVIVVFVFGGLLAMQTVQLQQLSRELARYSQQQKSPAQQPGVPQPPTAPAPVPTPTEKVGQNVLIGERNVKTGNVSLTFTQYCNGTARQAENNGPGSATWYCIGDATLSLFDNLGRTLTISKTHASKAEEAYALLGVDLVPSNADERIILVSYQKNTCDTNLDACGAGIPMYYVTYRYNVGDNTVTPLSNFPSDGRIYWNPAGTKAAVVPNTCGGAGCGVDALGGYDLMHDMFKTLTKEKAAGISNDVGPSEAGFFDAKTQKPVQYWYTVEWTDNDTFTATRVVPPTNAKATTTVHF